MAEAGNISLRRPRGSALRGPLVHAQRTSLLIPLFMFSLALPIMLHLGPLRLSPYRLLLIVAFIPCLLAWINGSMGRIRAPDLLILAAALWTTVALAIHQGAVQALESGGIYLVETFGTYLLARWLIRDAKSFEAMARSLFWVIAVLLPFAIIEAVTARPILNEILGTVFEVFPDVPKEPRWGMDRVQGPFQHPILFGVFCSAGFALSYYVLGFGRRGLARLLRPAVVVVSVGLSLSSGPLSALIAQLGIITWDRIFRRFASRWTIFFILVAAAYVVVDLLSNRTPIKVFISYTAFNPSTAYGRLLIWEYGSATVMRHPLFGTGGPWEHPAWLTDSVDMFWLATALIAGIPAAVAIALAATILAVILARAEFGDPRLAACRAGLVVTIAGLCLVGWAVHFWNATLALFMFILGSGTWMLDVKQPGHDAPDTAAPRRTAGRAKRIGRSPRQRP
jgi:hypothetical protein